MHKQEAGMLFNALAEGDRVKIVKKLYNLGELCYCKIVDFSDCNESTLSQHLSILVDSGLIASRKEGESTYYSANKNKIDELMDFIKTPCGCMNKK